MSYKKLIGNLLKCKRVEKGLTQKDIVNLSDLTLTSVARVEKGEASDIDTYIEYGRSFSYALNIADLGFKMEPKYSLKKEAGDRIPMTSFIYELLETDFFDTPQKVEDIKKKLVELKKIDNSIKTTRISSVLTHFLDKKILDKDKKGNINLYFK